MNVNLHNAVGAAESASDEDSSTPRELLPDANEVMRAKERDPMMFVSGFDADDDGIEPPSNPDAPGERLLTAAEEGNLAAIKELLEDDPKLIEYQDGDGYTALHRACYEDNLEIARELLCRGARLDATTEDNWMPLHSACHWNSYKCVRLLLENGADVNAKTAGGSTPLHVASNQANTRETLIILLNEPGIIVDSVNKAGETPLQIARRSGKLYPLFEVFRDCFRKI